MPKSKYYKEGLYIIIIAFILSLIGCAHLPLPNQPKNAICVPEEDEINLSDPIDQAVLQIIIAYGPLWCNHTALRLVCPKKPVIFWDPGGGYAMDFDSKARIRDLILVDPPDLETYLMFRWKNYDNAVEIFEWYISKDYADGLHDILIKGTDKDHPAGRFDTYTPVPFCSSAVSDFLNRFAKDLMIVPEKYFFPHNLSRTLYTQSPDRVITFKRNGVRSVYTP